MIGAFDLLARDAQILGGKPIIKGTRISVALVLEWLSTGGTPEAIQVAYPGVSVAAVHQALRYASQMMTASDTYDLTIVV